MKNTNNTVHVMANEEIQQLVELARSKYAELVGNTSVEGLVDLLVDPGYVLKNIPEYTLIVGELKTHSVSYKRLVIQVIKLIMTGELQKSQKLSTVINRIAEYFPTRSVHSRVRVATAIVRLLQQSELFAITEVMNEKGNKVRQINYSYVITEVGLLDLGHKTRNLPKSEPVPASSDMVGHTKKVKGENAHMLDITEVLNNTAYTLDPRVWGRYKHPLADYRFGGDMNFAIRTAFITEGDDLLGKIFYFGHKFEPGVGRIYCDGDLFTLQAGALNFAYKFADKRMLTEQGFKALEERIQELKEEKNLVFKEEVELYSLELDMEDAKNGKPVGTILHKDAKLSGLQHQCIATRSKSEALYCGLLDSIEDGYEKLRTELSSKETLTRSIVKSAYNPYQYGSGEAKTLEPVIASGGSLDFKEWEKAYKTVFPTAFGLRSYLLELASSYPADIHTFTSPSGFNCVITALGREEDHIMTCYGKLTYEHKEIHQDHMGIKIVAAFSQMLDASLLHEVVRGTTFDISVVHDSFGTHPNNTAKLEELYVHGLQKNLVTPILENFVSSITGIARVNVGKLLENTLRPTDIVGGLF